MSLQRRYCPGRACTCSSSNGRSARVRCDTATLSLFFSHCRQCTITAHHTSSQVLLSLALKGVPYTPHQIDLGKGENRSAYFVGINPRGLVPAMVCDGRVFIESNDVLLHIEEKFTSPPALLPSDPEQAEQVRKILQIQDDYHMSMRNISFRTWRDAETLIAMGQSKVAAMDVDDVSDDHVEGGQGRAEQRSFYQGLVDNRGIPDEQLQSSMDTLRTHLSDFDSAYASADFLVPGAGLTIADVAVWVDVERLLDTQGPSRSGMDVKAEFPHLHAAYLRLADQVNVEYGFASTGRPA